MIPSPETLSLYAHTNESALSAPVRGIVVDHMGLGSQWRSDSLSARDFDLGSHGILLLVPYNDPWCWMNDRAIANTDALLDALKAKLSLPAALPVCSSGGSMGGLSAIVHACRSRHSIASVVVNCPVCDRPYHLTERPDLPRTLWAAFGDAPDFDAALRAHSPLHLVPSMPDVPYHVFHSSADQAVNRERHSDRLVEALRAAGRRVAYVVSEGTGHCDLRAEVRRQHDEAILSAFE